MDITVTGRKMQVTDAIREYAEEKIEAACKVFDIDPMSAEVVLHVEKNPSNPKSAVAEVTLRTKKHIVRVEEAAEDMYAAIDIAADKTERQLRKYKTKVVDRRVRARQGIEGVAAPDDLPPVDFLSPEEDDLVRIKEIDFQNLSLEEALIQIDLLGHDFFIYNDATTGMTQVVYRRGAGGYGLIKPRIEENEEEFVQ